MDSFERLSVRHLRTLRILYETRSISRTAEQVCRSQPAVSLQIRELEQIVGFDLIYHQRGALTFTAQGKAFFQAAQKFERELKTAVTEIYNAPERPVTVGVTEDFYSILINDTKNFKNLKVRFLSMNSDNIVKEHADKRIDLGVAKAGAPLKNAVKTWRQPLCWAGKPRSQSTAASSHMAVLSSGCFYHRLAQGIAGQRKRKSVSIAACKNWAEIAERLRHGGLTIVPANWAASLGYWSEKAEFPSLPDATLNLIGSESCSDASAYVARKISKIISSSHRISKFDHGAWKNNNIRLFH